MIMNTLSLTPQELSSLETVAKQDVESQTHVAPPSSSCKSACGNTCAGTCADTCAIGCAGDCSDCTASCRGMCTDGSPCGATCSGWGGPSDFAGGTLL